MYQRVLISASLDVIAGVIASTPGSAAGQRVAVFALPSDR
jgi:hypothetical protein